MGQTSSIPKQSRKRSLRSPFLRRSTSQKAPISHTFVLMDDDQKLEQLNINLATEEELMTLPGVDREIARNVVEYRKAIGRFRKVEDLALVRGVGAEKFEYIKAEVCVKNNSCNSSRSQSFDSLSVENKLTPRPIKRLVDINNASVFELQCVHGMTQEMAANILHYRTKKGMFKKVEDLLKVKGFDQLRFSNMRHQLTIDTVLRSSSDILSNGTCNGIIPTGKHKKSSSAPIKFNISNGLLQSSVNDIFELLSAYSPRPIFTEEFKYIRNNREAIRVATWNLHEFTPEKAQNLGVQEVICRTILENGWSIVCFQEVEDQNALQVLCDELNFPKLRRVNECKQNSRQWHFCMFQSHQAILYDVHSGGIGIEMKQVIETPMENYNTSLVQFCISSLVLAIVNVRLPEKFPLNSTKIQEIVDKEDPLLLLGDFSNLHTDVNNSVKKINDLEAVLPLNANTTYSNLKLKYSDNIFVNLNAKTFLTGIWGVVRQGLTHLAIPNGWSWGGPVSPHCPLWIELYIKPGENDTL